MTMIDRKLCEHSKYDFTITYGEIWHDSQGVAHRTVFRKCSNCHKTLSVYCEQVDDAYDPSKIVNMLTLRKLRTNS